jgi:heme oxygenase
MSGVTVSISLTRKQQGQLYMQNMRRGERIREFRAGLKRIIELADEAENFAISAAAKALLEVKQEAQKGDSNDQ